MWSFVILYSGQFDITGFSLHLEAGCRSFFSTPCSTAPKMTEMFSAVCSLSKFCQRCLIICELCTLSMMMDDLVTPIFDQDIEITWPPQPSPPAARHDFFFYQSAYWPSLLAIPTSTSTSTSTPTPTPYAIAKATARARESCGFRLPGVRRRQPGIDNARLGTCGNTHYLRSNRPRYR